MAEIVFQRRDVTLYNGDCLNVLKTLEDCSVDSVVTDPPAGIAFMGKKWDAFTRPEFIAFLSGVMKECLRVLKPGGHAVVWSIPRTSHWTGTALEDAGFEIRDVVLHLFGSGFPKSLDVSKAIDKAAGVEREVVSSRKLTGKARVLKGGNFDGGYEGKELNEDYAITAPATDAAKQWSGYGTALKPAAEFWWLCRKPLESTVAANVQKWGTGALNIDGCRVSLGNEKPPAGSGDRRGGDVYAQDEYTRTKMFNGGNVTPESGRWPANVTHDGSPEVLENFPDAPGQLAEISLNAPSEKCRNAYSLKSRISREGEATAETRYTDNGGTNFAPLPGQRRFDSGSAARFYYCAKASTSERGRSNDHPTVKPIDLMRWLCRLVTPPDGVVLDCFSGSGSTLVAAREEGFKAIGIERELHYCEIIKQRMAQDVMF